MQTFGVLNANTGTKFDVKSGLRLAEMLKKIVFLKHTRNTWVIIGRGCVYTHLNVLSIAALKKTEIKLKINWNMYKGVISLVVN